MKIAILVHQKLFIGSFEYGVFFECLFNNQSGQEA